MKFWLAKYRKGLIIAITAVLIFLNIANLYFILGIAPMSNDECLWIPKKITQDSTIVTIQKVKKDGVTWNAGIRNGDRLLEINGQTIKNTRDAQFILNSVAKGDSAIYLVSRNGKTFQAKVEVKKLISFQSLGYALLAFIWLLVAFVVVLAKSEGEVQRLFYLLGALFTFISLISFFQVGYLQNPYFFVSWLIIAVDLIWLIGSSYLPFSLVHFFWIFPRRAKIISRKYTLKILYGIPTIIFLFALLVRFKYFYFRPVNLFNLPRSAFIIMYFIPAILIFLGMLIGFILLFKSYLKLENKRERSPIFVILVAYGIGIASIIYTQTLANVLADTIFNTPEYFMPIIFVALIPIAFGYSIFRYSLMDVTEVIKNAILYSIATVTLGVLYFLIIYLLGQNISQVLSTDYQGIIAAVIFIIFAIIFQSTKDRFQDLLTKKFYPEQFAYQKVILKFSNEITGTIGLENILDSTSSTFNDALKLKRFAILLKNKKRDFILKRGTNIKAEYFVLHNSEEALVKIIQEKKLVHLHPVIEREDFSKVFPKDFELLKSEGIYTIIPLMIKSKIIGLLLFGLKHSGAHFAGKDLELLSAAANQVAVAIENARLYESEAEKLKIERDIENAKRIQESLLPKEFPKIERLEICGIMKPALQIGGDYFDLIKIDNNSVFVIVADVSGKGLSASFYMSKIQTMTRLYCKKGKTPKEILKKVNEEIYGAIERSWFITISLALINTEKMEMQFCRAGHTQAIKTDGHSFETLIPSGIAVGLQGKEVFNNSLEELKIKLTPNDLLCFFSDGLSEAMNEKKELFRIDRIKETILNEFNAANCEIIQNKLLSQAEKFRGSAHQNDDITLVLIRVK